MGNMPFSVTENQFREAFKEFGKILEFELRKDERSGKPKGQGTILFERQDEAKDAIRVMDQARFNDRVVLCKEDTSLQSSPVKESRYEIPEHENKRDDRHPKSFGDFNRRNSPDRRERNFGPKKDDWRDQGPFMD